MEKDKEKTVVVFRVWHKPNYGVIAIFPEMRGSRIGLCWSYEHVGQHGECDPQGIVARSSPAKLFEIDALYVELESIGYNLTVKKRITNADLWWGRRARKAW